MRQNENELPKTEFKDELSHLTLKNCDTVQSVTTFDEQVLAHRGSVYVHEHGTVWGGPGNDSASRTI